MKRVFRCLFEIFTAIVAKADVQMVFAPSDEDGFFEALHAGRFDAKDVCSRLDAMQASATVEADKQMITSRIQKEIGMQSYNKQLRQFLEGQYRLVAMKVRERNDTPKQHGVGHKGGDGEQADTASGTEFAELLTHIRRLGDAQAAMGAQQAAICDAQAAMRAQLDELARR